MPPNYKSCKSQNIRFLYKKNNYELERIKKKKKLERLNFKIGVRMNIKHKLLHFIIFLLLPRIWSFLEAGGISFS